MLEAAEQFREAIRAAGLAPPDTIEADGHLRRFAGDGRRGSDASWYVLHGDGVPAGAFGDWRSGLSQTWRADTGRKLTPAEEAAHRARVEAMRQAREAEEARAHQEAAAKAAEILRSGRKDDISGHPYAAKKAIDFGPLVRRGAWPQRGWIDALLVPIYNADGQVISLEAINASGDKDFLRGGAKRGGIHPIGNIKTARRVLIAEGIANAAVAIAALGDPAVAAMDAGNLKAAGETVRQINPGAELVFLADNDVREDGRNPGAEAATSAALALGGKVAIPELDGRKCDFWDLLHERGAEAVKRAIEAASEPTSSKNSANSSSEPCGEEWPEPQPLAAKFAPEPYPADALPEIIGAAIKEVQAFTHAPLPLVASSALAAVSLACQSHFDVKRADKLQGPASMFLLSIADSGERKSTCDGFFTLALREYQDQQTEAAKPEIQRHKAALAAWEAEREGILSAIKGAAKAGKPADNLKRDLAELERDRPEPPRVPRLLLGDETPENLGWSLAKLWPSAGVLSSEAGLILGAHGMGRDSVMRNLALLNILWDGGAHSIGRRTSESYTVKGARLTVALQVQEATLREFFAKSGPLARGTGFLARFLVAWPESTQGQRPFSEAPAHWPHLTAFHRRIAAILANPAPLDENGGLTPALLSLAPNAKAAWVEYHDAIESELASGGELYDVRDVASKSADNAARLAALFHVFAHGTGGAVGLEAFEGASRIAAWHLSEARRFFGELALPAELADAGRLDSFLIKHCRAERTHLVPTREAQRLGPIRDKERLAAALRELEELDRVRVAHEGRRKTIKVNPALAGVTS